MDENDLRPRCFIRGAPSVFEMGSVKDYKIHPDRVLDYWVFAVVTEGRMPIQIREHQAVLRPEQYFLLPPGIRHFGTERGIFDAVWLHFTCPEEANPSSDLLVRHLALYGPIPPEMSYLAWGNLLRRSMATSAMTWADLDIQLMAMLGQVAAEDLRRSPNRSHKSIADRTLELLLKCYSEVVNTQRLASELGYSYAHIEREFRKSYGVTIRQKLTEIRVDEAQALITMGTSLRDAALETGFSDYYYFIRVFTKLKGFSPGRLSTKGVTRTTVTSKVD